MKDIEKLKTEVMDVIKDVFENCKNLDTVYNVVNWAINEVSDECVKNVLKIYEPKGKENEKDS